MGEQVGRALDLVEDQMISLREKAPRIRERPRPQVRCLERKIAMVRKEGAHQGGLSRLPGAGERHDRAGRSRRPQRVRQVTVQHARDPARGGTTVSIR